MASQVETVDDYISSFPPNVQGVLEELRATIHSVIPNATERISYGIAAIALDGKDLLGFAGWKHHVGFYPVHRMPAELEARISPYRSGKATLRFPLAEPLPYDLVRRVVEVLASTRSG